MAARKLKSPTSSAKPNGLTTVAHDLRNSLAALQTAVSVLKSADQEQAVINRALGIIERQVQRMVRLSDDLVAICRAATGVEQAKEGSHELRAAIYSTGPEPDLPVNTSAACKRRILLVEDDADVAEGLAMLLRDVGHEVWIADNCDAAMETASANSPEIILLDLCLPDKDGYEVAKLLREQCGMDRALLVALTGQGKEADPERALAAGFNTHLTKPTTLAALEEVFAQAPGTQV